VFTICFGERPALLVMAGLVPATHEHRSWDWPAAIAFMGSRREAGNDEEGGC
jgi:hypothetical protein